jgi:pilus assembly protein Flp/PilA
MDRTRTQAAERTGMLNDGKSVTRFAARMGREEDGVTAIEYALLASLIAMVCILAFQVTGTSLKALYQYWSAVVIATLQ